MRALIVRHAIAAERDPETYPDDDLRPLTERGVRRMRQQARGLAGALDRPGALYTSPLRRAIETARIVALAWGKPPLAIEETRMLGPGPAPAEVGRWLTGLKLDATVVVVGHEPGCSELLSHLLVGSGSLHSDFKKGAAALVELSSTAPHSRGVLLWMASPRLLRGGED